METIGNPEILKMHKTAFLCSRKYPSEVVAKSYDWAISQRDSGKCVISGFHSQIEKDVFHFLLKGKQPIILALARGIPKRIEPKIKDVIDKGRLLMVSPFEKKVTRVTEETAQRRNALMVEIADEIIVAYARENGLLERLVQKCNLTSGKIVRRFA